MNRPFCEGFFFTVSKASGDTIDKIRLYIIFYFNHMTLFQILLHNNYT